MFTFIILIKLLFFVYFYMTGFSCKKCIIFHMSITLRFSFNKILHPWSCNGRKIFLCIFPSKAFCVVFRFFSDVWLPEKNAITNILNKKVSSLQESWYFMNCDFLRDINFYSICFSFSHFMLPSLWEISDVWFQRKVWHSLTIFRWILSHCEFFIFLRYILWENAFPHSFQNISPPAPWVLWWILKCDWQEKAFL